MIRDPFHTLHLKAVLAAVELDALTRILQVFHDRDVNPRKVTAQRVFLRTQDREVLQVEIELAVSELTLDTLRFIAASIAQMPSTLSTVFGSDDEGSGLLNQPQRPDNV